MVRRLSRARSLTNDVHAIATSADEWHLERLISIADSDPLYHSFPPTVIRSRAPDANGGLLLTVGGVLGLLTIAGILMLAIGFALLGDDVHLLRSVPHSRSDRTTPTTSAGLWISRRSPYDRS